MKYRCRCRRCRKRKNLSQPPSWYVKQPRCPNCGASEWTVDEYRQSRQDTRLQTCHCDGFPYPHRIGSGSGMFSCKHEPDRLNRLLRESGLIQYSSPYVKPNDPIPF